MCNSFTVLQSRLPLHNKPLRPCERTLPRGAQQQRWHPWVQPKTLRRPPTPRGSSLPTSSLSSHAGGTGADQRREYTKTLFSLAALEAALVTVLALLLGKTSHQKIRHPPSVFVHPPTRPRRYIYPTWKEYGAHELVHILRFSTNASTKVRSIE